jgi:hypothetical protein
MSLLLFDRIGNKRAMPLYQKSGEHDRLMPLDSNSDKPFPFLTINLI